MFHQRAYGVLWAVVLALTACGGSDDAVDPLQSFKSQPIDWQPCNPAVFSPADHGQALSLVGLRRVRCANVKVPLDYANPAAATLSIGLMRVSAGDPAARQGALFFNPGGPGGDGYTMPLIFGALFDVANTADPDAALMAQISQRFDLIGFSPRGTGYSSTVSCESAVPPLAINDPTLDRSAENLSRMFANAELVAKACQASPIAAHIHTEATVQDLDLIRQMLGESKFNLFGYSYGTWLGTWYASRFPQHTGRMVFDSSMDVTNDYAQAVVNQLNGRQRVIEQVLVPYVSRFDTDFQLGDTSQAVWRNLNALRPALLTWLKSDLQLNNSQDVSGLVGRMMAAYGLEQVMQAVDSQDPVVLRSALDKHVFSAVPEINAEVLNVAYSYFEPPQPVIDLYLSPEHATYAMVVCNDAPWVGDTAYWTQRADQLIATTAAWTGGDLNANENSCLFWKLPARQRPDVSQAATVGPILMVQSRWDALTPLEGAQNTLNALPNAQMILVGDNEYSHGLFPYSACVNTPVANYLLSGQLPDATLHCPGLPLPQDAQAATAAMSESVSDRRAQVSSTTQQNPYWTDEIAAQQMLKSIRDMIR